MREQYTWIKPGDVSTLPPVMCWFTDSYEQMQLFAMTGIRTPARQRDGFFTPEGSTGLCHSLHACLHQARC